MTRWQFGRKKICSTWWIILWGGDNLVGGIGNGSNNVSSWFSAWIQPKLNLNESEHLDLSPILNLEPAPSPISMYIVHPQNNYVSGIFWIQNKCVSQNFFSVQCTGLSGKIRKEGKMHAHYSPDDVIEFSFHLYGKLCLSSFQGRTFAK